MNSEQGIVTSGDSGAVKREGPVRSYRDLLVWQKGIDLVSECYKLSGRFPRDERFGLTNQLRRAAVSVPANIAEVQGRGSPKAFLQFLWIANGSLTEVETHLAIAARLGFVSADDCTVPLALAEEVGRMLTGLRRSLDKTV
ncbi:MAG: four helix bundle protein [Planctomycetaceae bacterium]